MKSESHNVLRLMFWQLDFDSLETTQSDSRAVQFDLGTTRCERFRSTYERT